MEDRIFNYKINDGFLWSEVNLKGEKHYYVEGYASTIDEDKSGEIIDYSAQEDIHKQIQNENITMDLEHEEWYGDDGKILAKPKNTRIPIAKIIHSELRPQGVWIKAELNQHLKSFPEIWGSIKDKFLKAFSIAFYPIQKLNNVIKSLNLVNITLTGSPVNTGSDFRATMKSALAHLKQVEQDSIGVDKIDEDGDIKSEDKMVEELKCKKCEAEFKGKEEYDAHLKKCKGGNEMDDDKDKKGVDVKADTPIAPEEPVKDAKADVAELSKKKEDLGAEIKALKEQLESTIKSQNDEIAKLKAEIAKPVMKAKVEEVPEIKIKQAIISPLGMVGR